jgi:hypothetical protein
MSDEVLIPDSELDPGFRDFIAQFLTPRTGLDGKRYWPIDEISLEALASEPAPCPELARLELADDVRAAEQPAGDLQ